MAREESRRIATQLERAVNGPAWHGPSVREAVRGVSAAKAAARPLPKGHSIWELVLHATAWLEIVRKRVEGTPPSVTPAMNWPKAGRQSAAEWRRAVLALTHATARLGRTIRSLDDRRLGRHYLGLHGVVQHTIYHAGQIAMLKKSVLKGRP